MKMTYMNLNVSELEQRLESLLPGAKELVVELSLDGDGPTILGKEVMSQKSILELVEKQGFKVNDIVSVYSGGGLRDCIGITLNKPFIHDKTNENIEGIFVLGNLSDSKENNYLYSFLLEAAKPYFENIRFSIDIVAENKETAKASFFERIASFKYPTKDKEIRFTPVTYDNGEWVEMEPEEDEREVRFLIEDLTVERLNEVFKKQVII